MIAISSFRSLETSDEVALNQIRALRSWDTVFSSIVLFGTRDPRLETGKTTFVECEDFPRLSALMSVAALSEEPSAILNADIVVSPYLGKFSQEILQKGFDAFTSRRYEFDPGKLNYESANVKDLGADFFCAKPSVWYWAWKAIPDAYRIGCPTWDNWLLGYWGLTLKKRFCDATQMRLIFHPKHTERKRIALGEIPRDRYIDSGCGFPRTL